MLSERLEPGCQTGPGVRLAAPSGGRGQHRTLSNSAAGYGLAALVATLSDRERGANGLILNVEGFVPQDQKGEARRQLPQSVAKVARNSASVLVRVNGGLRALAADLDAAVMAGVDALVLPKTDSADWVLEIGVRFRNLNGKEICRWNTSRSLPRPRGLAKAHSHCVGPFQNDRNGARP